MPGNWLANFAGWSNNTPKRRLFSKDWELRRQIRNSSGSAMDCIAEDFERGSNREFRYFLGMAKGSCGEVRSQGYRTLDYGYISEEEQVGMDLLAKRTSAAIHGLIDYLNKPEIKGQRHSKLAKSESDPFFPSQSPPWPFNSRTFEPSNLRTRNLKIPDTPARTTSH